VHVWRFSVGQASARRILAQVLDRHPRSLAFERGPYGQPRLVDAGGVEFSTARSGDIGVLAVTYGRAVGVDVEQIEPRHALGPIADRLFGDDEADELRSLSDERRVRRFYELWTQKEAYAKALGTGLAIPLRRLRAPAGWAVSELDVGPGHVGALCVRGSRLRVRLHG
jgi:4'-phosphopantetheinyl transferase